MRKTVGEIFKKAMADAKDHIPSEEITYTEMMENLAHAAGRKIVLWPDQCHSPKFCGEHGSCRHADCTHAGNEFSKRMMEATNPRKHWPPRS